MISIIYKILTNNPPEGGNWEFWIQLRRNRIHLEWLTGGWLKVKRTTLPHLKTDCCRSTTWYLLCSVLTPAIFLHLYLYLYLYCFLLFNALFLRWWLRSLPWQTTSFSTDPATIMSLETSIFSIWKFQNIFRFGVAQFSDLKFTDTCANPHRRT